MLLAGVPAACGLDVSPLSQLQSLSMVRCSLTVVPAGVYSCARLRHLDLSSNSILEVRHPPTSKILSLVASDNPQLCKCKILHVLNT